MTITCTYEDTCLVEYLDDHHHRIGELLLGILVCGQSEEDAVDMLWDELCSQDWGEIHLSKDAVTEDDCRRAFAEAVKGVDFRPFDEDGNRVNPENPDYNRWQYECDSQVWVLLKWKVR